MSHAPATGPAAVRVKQLCVPRDLSSLSRETETVHDLADLGSPGKLDPAQFFKTTFVTTGMAAFVQAVFDRFAGSGGSPVICLSQSMGGGKTHNLLAAGLLAKYPSHKSAVAHIPALKHLVIPEGLRVLSFSGREHNVAFWESFAAQLGVARAFRTSEGKLIVPSPEDWQKVLGTEKTLILLDELPPYFHSIAGKGHASVSVCSASDLTTALVSLFGAAAKMPNLVVVYTDLDGAVYDIDFAGKALAELRKVQDEASRLMTRIEPIKLGSDEFFGVLRKRLFDQLPTAAQVDVVAEAYAEKYRSLKKAGVIGDVGTDHDFKQEIVQAYPFHPKWKDLYSRISHNPNFQQTRGLLRLIGAQVKEVFESTAAGPLLVGPQHLPVGDSQVHHQLMLVNNTLQEAMAIDVTSSGAAKAHASLLDEDKGFNGLASEVATLVLVASLPNSQGQVPGLTEAEIKRTFISPEWDMAKVAELLQSEGLTAHCEYLHFIPSTKRYVFKQVTNPHAALRNRAAGFSESLVIQKLQAYLEDKFAPKAKNAYQAVKAFPSVQDIKLERDKVLLVIEGGQPSLDPEYREFFKQTDLKNRILFLVNSKQFSKVIEDARYYFAAQEVAGAMQDSGDRDVFEQIKKSKETQFHITVASTYNSIFYPSIEDEPSAKALDTKLNNGAWNGETLIEEALLAEEKLVVDSAAQSLIIKIERLMNPKRLKWTSLLEKMARSSDFPFVPLATLEAVKAKKLLEGSWRAHEDTGELERGPFVDPATVEVQTVSVEEDGTAVLRLFFKGADVVYGAETADVSRQSATASTEMRTKSPRLYFLPVHSRGTYKDGAIVEWRHPLRICVQQVGAELSLKALPAGRLTYSYSDASLDVDATEYKGPFQVPAGATKVRVRAELDGVIREESIPLRGAAGPGAGPVKVSRKLTRTDRQSSLVALTKLKQYATQVGFSIDLSLSSGKAMSLNCYQGLDSDKPWAPEDAEQVFLACLNTFAANPTDGVNLSITEAVFHNRNSAEDFAEAVGEVFDDEDYTYVR